MTTVRHGIESDPGQSETLLTESFTEKITEIDGASWDFIEVMFYVWISDWDLAIDGAVASSKDFIIVRAICQLLSMKIHERMFRSRHGNNDESKATRTISVGQ